MQSIATFQPPPPYDFRRTVEAARYYSPLGQMRDGGYWRALRTPGGLALVKLVGSGTPEQPRVDAYLAASNGPVDRAHLQDTVARLLNLHLDLSPFYAFAESHPALRQIVRPLHGLHIFQTETLFEALALTVIEQQIALSAAQRAERWLIEWAGDGLTYEGQRFAVFPSAARLATATVEALTPLKITFRRMQVLIDAAIQDAQQPLEALRPRPANEIYNALVRLKGVGHWTAAWTMNRGLGQLVYVGSADVALRAAAHHYFLGAPGRLTPQQTDELFAGFGAYAGLAAYYTLMKWAFDRYPAPPG